jgi:hypothetical protein
MADSFRLPILRERLPHCRWKSMPWLLLLCCLTHWADAQANPLFKKPLAVSANFRYFQDSGGAPVMLNGSQTWNTLQDWGTGGSTAALDFDAFVRFLVANGHNFTLLWRVEQPKVCGLPVNDGAAPEFTVSPQPWMRTGPGKPPTEA